MVGVMVTLFAVNAVSWALALWRGGKWETSAIWVSILSAGPLVLAKLWKVMTTILNKVNNHGRMGLRSAGVGISLYIISVLL
jgi:hypothetical protein